MFIHDHFWASFTIKAGRLFFRIAGSHVLIEIERTKENDTLVVWAICIVDVINWAGQFTLVSMECTIWY